MRDRKGGAGFGALVLACLIGLALAGASNGDLRAADAPARGSLAGQLLVASDNMRDPRFNETVIYMVEHDMRGAMGLVVNVPLGEVPFADLLERLGLEPEGADGSMPVYYGGPVERGRGFFLHSTDVMLEGSIRVADGVAMTAQPDILGALARGEGPSRSLFALGYAGWGPGQLESELAHDAWFVIPAETSLIFAEDPAKTWQRAVALRSIDL
ncbi:MAG: YqgE/AlgH family protein [Kiloniellaceae bacterium]